VIPFLFTAKAVSNYSSQMNLEHGKEQKNIQGHTKSAGENWGEGVRHARSTFGNKIKM
jgi:hypothetical protein